MERALETIPDMLFLMVTVSYKSKQANTDFLMIHGDAPNTVQAAHRR